MNTLGKGGSLRPARPSDSVLLFNWRNEKTTRENSFNTDPLVYGDHEKWFKKALADPDVRIFIYEESEEAAGQVRIVREGSFREISYSIDAERRGRGMAVSMLKLLEEQLRAAGEGAVLLGRVRPGNTASIRVFEKLGYSREDEDDEIRFTKQI